MMQGQPTLSSPQVCARTAQLCDRCPQSHVCGVRMDLTSSYVQAGLPGVGCTAGVSVCNSLTSPVTSACVSPAGPECLETGHVCLPLGGLRSVHLSPLLPDLSRTGSDQRVLLHQCVSLIAPWWHQADWFPLLLSLLVDRPQVLPPWTLLLCQSHRHLLPKSPGTLHLHTWRLSSVSSKRKAFHRKLLELWPFWSDSPPPGFIRQSGPSSVVGVNQRAVILSQPL